MHGQAELRQAQRFSESLIHARPPAVRIRGAGPTRDDGLSSLLFLHAILRPGALG